MTPEQVAIFTDWQPDPLGELLGTGFKRFSAKSGIRGLARASVSRLDVLVVISLTPGKGQFRQFISDAKKAFPELGIWEDMNPLICEILERYGFRRAALNEDGEISPGWLWNRAAQGVSLGADGMSWSPPEGGDS